MRDFLKLLHRSKHDLFHRQFVQDPIFLGYTRIDFNNIYSSTSRMLDFFYRAAGVARFLPEGEPHARSHRKWQLHTHYLFLQPRTPSINQYDFLLHHNTVSARLDPIPRFPPNNATFLEQERVHEPLNALPKTVVL